MNEQYIKIDKDGHKVYYKDREMTILHREDGPAIEFADGSKYWYMNGKCHREDGPAIEFADGSKHWYFNDSLHRKDGPAIVWPDGSKYWFQNGKLHREDGPAIEEADGSKSWYLGSKKLTEKKHAKQTVKEVIVSMNDIAKMLNIPVEKLKIKK